MRSIIFAIFILLLPACGEHGPEGRPIFLGVDLTGSELGGDFSLEDSSRKLRRLSDFRGKVTALFFGYTHCPDVCPTTMSILAKASQLLGLESNRVQVLFVTLDPDRDTAEVMGKYAPSFDPAFIGLRGDENSTEKIARNFKIFYSKEKSSSRSGYTIDHSAGVYVYDMKGKLRLYFNHGQKPEDMAHDFRLLLSE